MISKHRHVARFSYCDIKNYILVPSNHSRNWRNPNLHTTPDHYVVELFYRTQRPPTWSLQTIQPAALTQTQSSCKRPPSR